MIETPRRKSLRKQERLYEKALIDLVFQKGNSIHNAPIKLLWMNEIKKSEIPVSKNSIHIKVGFSVPKRVFKKAVTRNLLKRRMREAYRKNKINETGLKETYALMFIYSGRKINLYPEIESKIVLTLQHFKTAIGAE
jgi:ribonuclease P protein component